MKKVNREHIKNTTTPDERSEKEGLARNQGNELRELSSEELESIIGGVGVRVELGVPDGVPLAPEVDGLQVVIDGLEARNDEGGDKESILKDLFKFLNK